MKKVVTKQTRKYGSKNDKSVLKLEQCKKIDTIKKLIKERKLLLAHKSIENYIDLYGNDCYIIYQLAILYIKESKYDKAKYYLNINVKNNSDNKYYCLYKLAQIYSHEEDYEEALNIYYEILKSNNHDKSYSLLEIARIYSKQKKLEEAEEILKNMLIKKTINYQYILEEMIEIKIFKNELEEAEKYLMLLKNTDSKKTIYLNGRIEFLKGNLTKSKEIFETIENDLNSYNYNSKLYLAKISYEEEDYIKTLKIVKEMEKMLSYDTEDYIVLCIKLYIVLKKYDIAKEKIDKLSKMGKKYENEVNYYLGKVEFRENNYINAYKFFKKVEIDNIKLYNFSNLNKIFILIKLKKYKEAIDEYKELKKINFHNEEIIRIIELYLKKMTGNHSNIKATSYIEKMIVNYNKIEVIKHIEKHKTQNNNKKCHTLFNDNVDIEKLYDYAIKNINEKTFLWNDFTDSYLLECENISVDKSIKYIKVITLPNTKEIITIYPLDNTKSYLIESSETINEKLKVKKTSQIEKFNRKYRIS